MEPRWKLKCKDHSWLLEMNFHICGRSLHFQKMTFRDLAEQAGVLGSVRERKTPAQGDILEKDNSEEVSGEKQKAYRSIVGKLLYIYPEVPFCQWVINRLAQKMSKPTFKMVKAALHFVGFLTTVQDVGLLLPYKTCSSSVLANGGDFHRCRLGERQGEQTVNEFSHDFLRERFDVCLCEAAKSYCTFVMRE